MNKLREEIARVAYELFEKRGRGHGQHCDDWLEAEKIVMARHAKGTEKGEKPAGTVRRKAVAKAPKAKETTGDGKESPKKRITARKTVARKKTL
jgi:hypothetical protein